MQLYEPCQEAIGWDPVRSCHRRSELGVYGVVFFCKPPTKTGMLLISKYQDKPSWSTSGASTIRTRLNAMVLITESSSLPRYTRCEINTWADTEEALTSSIAATSISYMGCFPYPTGYHNSTSSSPKV